MLKEEAGADDNNTATADVEVCAKTGLGIAKTAEASFDREYLWKLAKKANDPTKVEIDLDGEAAFDYTVTATPNGYEDSNHSLTGGITLTNPNEFAAGDITATVADDVDIKGLTCEIDAKDIDPDTKGLQVLVPAGSVGDEGSRPALHLCRNPGKRGLRRPEHGDGQLEERRRHQGRRRGNRRGRLRTEGFEEPRRPGP